MRYFHLLVVRPVAKPHLMFPDGCQGDIFCGAWFCPRCGTEICGDCRADLVQDEKAVRLNQRALHAAADRTPIVGGMDRWCNMHHPQGVY